MNPASFPSAEPQTYPFGPQQPQDPYHSQGWPQQQGYAPGSQPRANRGPRRRGSRKARGALIGLGALIVVVAIILGTAHNSPSKGNLAATSTSSTASAAAPTASASSPPDCRSQTISWRDNGGLTQLDAVITDMGNVQKAATAIGADMSSGADATQDEASLQTAAASLQADAQTAQANLPPSCVPHLRADEGAALNYAAKAALDCQNAVSELGSGNDTVATDDINAASVAITTTGNQFQAAATDVQAFSNG